MLNWFAIANENEQITVRLIYDQTVVYLCANMETLPKITTARLTSMLAATPVGCLHVTLVTKLGNSSIKENVLVEMAHLFLINGCKLSRLALFE